MDNTSVNMLEVNDFFRTTLADVRGKLDPKILDNPKFDELFSKELSFFHNKTMSIDMNVKVSDDKKSVTIISNMPIVDCANPAFRGNNKNFLMSTFYLKGDNLVSDFCQGTLFSRKEIEKNGTRVSLSYEARLETNYSSRYFDADGIEYSDNSFSDVYPFSTAMEEIDLAEKVLSSFHRPEFNEYQLPNMPIHVMKGRARNTYRRKGTMAVIHSNVGIATINGYEDVVSALYTSHSSIPEMIRGGVLFAKTEKNDFRFSIIDNYAPDMKEAYSKAANDFRKEIEESNLKEYSERMYTALLSNI